MGAADGSLEQRPESLNAVGVVLGFIKTWFKATTACKKLYIGEGDMIADKDTDNPLTCIRVNGSIVLEELKNLEQEDA